MKLLTKYEMQPDTMSDTLSEHCPSLSSLDISILTPP